MFDGMSPADSYVLVQSRQGTYDKEDEEEGSERRSRIPRPNCRCRTFRIRSGAAQPSSASHTTPTTRSSASQAHRSNSEIRFHPDGTKTVTDLNPTEKPPITLVHVDFGDEDAWPDLPPFRLNLVEGNGAPRGTPTHGSSRSRCPRRRSRACGSARSSTTRHCPPSGIWRWIEEKKPPVSAQTKKRLQQLAQQGRHWMLTPFRELVLVHAVQQPLSFPTSRTCRSQGRSAARRLASGPGEGTCPEHGEARSRRDVDGALDPVAQPKWEPRSGSAMPSRFRSTTRRPSRSPPTTTRRSTIPTSSAIRNGARSRIR